MFCGVCVQCISGMLLGRHQYNRFPNRPLPFPGLPPRGSNCQLVHISKNRSPGAGPAPSPPREAPPDLASNPESTVTRVLSAFQVCSSLMVCLLLLVGEGWNVCTKTKWLSGGSLLWTVSPNPPTMSPPGFEPTPRELRARWLSTLVPRPCAHFPCICPHTSRLSSFGVWDVRGFPIILGVDLWRGGRGGGGGWRGGGGTGEGGGLGGFGLKRSSVGPPLPLCSSHPCLHCNPGSTHESPLVQRAGALGGGGGGVAQRAPGACPARYLCIKYPGSSPKFILTLVSPPSRPH